jgi:hypothetical protein
VWCSVQQQQPLFVQCINLLFGTVVLLRSWYKHKFEELSEYPAPLMAAFANNNAVSRRRGSSHLSCHWHLLIAGAMPTATPHTSAGASSGDIGATTSGDCQ